jgi:hypothetical protein
MKEPTEQYILFDGNNEVCGTVSDPNAVWPNGNDHVLLIPMRPRIAAHLSKELLKQIEDEVSAKRCGEPVTASS